MNRYQIARQVQHLLRQATWADAELVFAESSVVITLGTTETVLTEQRLPLALVRPGAASIDPDMRERPDLLRVEFAVGLVVANAQDQYGEAALVGSNRTGGSFGRGLLEVEERVLSALTALGPASGLPIVFRGASVAEPSLVPGLGYVAFCDYRFEALGTTAPTYEAPSGFLAPASGGTVSATWNSPTRWDHRRFILRRASGSTAPATSSSGSGVTLGGTPDGSGVTSVADTPGAGTWSYSLFAVYDDVDASDDEQTSAPQSVVGVVVT